jgi:transposase
MRILAMDLDKFNSHSCLLDVDARSMQSDSTPMRRDAIRGLLERHRPDRVVFEVSTDAGWIADLCRGLGITFVALNPSSLVRSSHRSRSKCDRRDAEDLARMAAIDPHLARSCVHMPEADVRERRSLIEQRAKAVERRTARRNEIRSLFQAHGVQLPAKTSAWGPKGLAMMREVACSGGLGRFGAERVELGLKGLESADEEIESLERMLDAIGEADPATELLQTVPGVGPRGAETVSAWIDDPGRFKSAKQVSNYAGMTPRPNQSGEMDRTSRISNAGPRRLRSMLVELAWGMLRWNPWAREVYERVLRGSPGRKKQAIVAVARRLLVRLWAMMRDGRAWDPEHGAGVAASFAGASH